MGTNPYREKMPNRGMGREMGKEEEEPRNVNFQEIGIDQQILGPGPNGLGTNFTHKTKRKLQDQK